jgi:hypothetical protein
MPEKPANIQQHNNGRVEYRKDSRIEDVEWRMEDGGWRMEIEDRR